MKLLIRLDASPKVGMGHLVRSLSIADKLSKVNPAITVNFIIRNDTLAVSAINEFNFRTYIYNGTEEEILSKAVKDHNPDLLFIDKIHEYSKNFILSLRIFTKVVMFHNICDGGYYADAFILPAAHVPDKIIDDIRWLHTSFYRGFNYIVLNDKIKELPKKSFLLDQNKLKFVITTGGSDPNGVMLKIIEWVNNPDFCNYEFCFLVGGAFMHRDKLNKIYLCA